MFLEANPMNSRFSKPGSVESLLYSDHGALTRLITLSITSAKEKKSNGVCRFWEKKLWGWREERTHSLCDSDPSSVKSALSLTSECACLPSLSQLPESPGVTKPTAKFTRLCLYCLEMRSHTQTGHALSSEFPRTLLINGLLEVRSVSSVLSRPSPQVGHTTWLQVYLFFLEFACVVKDPS